MDDAITTSTEAWARAERLRRIAREFSDDTGIRGTAMEMAMEAEALAERLEAAEP